MQQFFLVLFYFYDMIDMKIHAYSIILFLVHFFITLFILTFYYCFYLQAIEAVVALVSLKENEIENKNGTGNGNEDEHETSYLIKSAKIKSNENPSFIDSKIVNNIEITGHFGVFNSQNIITTNTEITNISDSTNSTNLLKKKNNENEKLNFEDRKNTFLMYKKGFFDCTNHLQLCENGLLKLQIMTMSQIADMKAVIHEPEILQK